MFALPTALIATLVAALTATPTTEAAPVVVEVVTANGSGCAGTGASVEALPDGRSFQVIFSGYAARTGAGAKATDFRKNCQFALRVRAAQDGLTYAVDKAEYSGFAHLESGATGLQRANYYFQGQTPTTFTAHTFTGPFDDAWQVTDMIDLAALVFAPCGEERFLNINTELRVRPAATDPTANNLMVIDQTAQFRLTFKQCP